MLLFLGFLSLLVITCFLTEYFEDFEKITPVKCQISLLALDTLIHCVQYTVISPNLLVWKLCGKAQFPQSFERFGGNCAFTQNLHTRKLGEITAFYVVSTCTIILTVFIWYCILYKGCCISRHLIILHKKMKISIFAFSCGFGYLYWRSPWWKTSCFMLCKGLKRLRILWNFRLCEFVKDRDNWKTETYLKFFLKVAILSKTFSLQKTKPSIVTGSAEVLYSFNKSFNFST